MIIIVLALVQINDYHTFHGLGIDRCMIYLTCVWIVTFRLI